MYGNHHLARNSQVQAARARLAQRQGVPAGAARANMAGCGPIQPVVGGEPLGVTDVGLQSGPPLPNPYQGGVVRQTCVPCMVIVQTEANTSTVAQLATKNNSQFYGNGVSSCNNCFEIILEEMNTSSLNYNLLPCGSIDPGIWNTDDCWCCFDIGCINTQSPLELVFRAFGTPSVQPFLSLAIWGVSDRAINDCGYVYGIPFPGYPLYDGGRGYVGGSGYPGYFPPGFLPPGAGGGGGGGGNGMMPM